MAEFTMAGALNAALRDALARRSARAGVRRGRRPLRRRVPRHRRPAGRVRRPSGCSTPRSARPAIAGAAVGLALRRVAQRRRDAVRRVLLPGARADRRPRREDARAHARARRHADHDPDPGVRRHQGQGAPRREPRDVLRAHRRPEGGGALRRAGRVPLAAPRDRRPRPRDRARAQGPVLGRRRTASSPSEGPGIGEGRVLRERRRLHGVRVRRDGGTLPRRRRRRWPSEGVARAGRRPAIALAARRGPDRPVRRARPAARWSCTRRRGRSGSGAEVAALHRWSRRSTTWRRRSRGSPGGTCRTRRPRWSTTTSRASTASRAAIRETVSLLMAERVFAMPDLGEGLEEGEIVAWLVDRGRRRRAEPAARRGRDREGGGRDPLAVRRAW